jgi:hypothetical protein
MSDVIFVHELYSLLDSGIRFVTSKLQKTHLAYLSKKGDELSKRLKRRFIKRTQKGLHKDGRVVWQLDDIQQMYAVISGIRIDGLRGEKLVYLELIRTFS